MEKLKLGDIYGFQYAEEKRIYNIICGKSKRKKGDLPECFKLNSYSEWKNYVWSKYETYNCQQLNNFLHYLKMQLRTINPTQKFIDMVCAAVFGVLISSLINVIVALRGEFEKMGFSIISVVAIAIVAIMVIVFPLCSISMNIFNNMICKSEDKDMYEDYISIIQEIIQSKENEEK